MKKQLFFVLLIIVPLFIIGQESTNSPSNDTFMKEYQDMLLFNSLTELEKEKIFESERLQYEKLFALQKSIGDNSFVSTSDSLALVTLYNSTGGSGWSNKTNWLTGPVHSWYGIYVNGGTIDSVMLASNSLTGSIPAAIGNLTDLKILDLHNNYLSGPIPSEIGNISNLEKLYLYYNRLTGSIPTEIANISTLVELVLYYNRLSGSIPSEIGNLTNLEVLYLTFNNITGPLPKELGNLTKLRQLIIWSNQLSGSIPPEIGNLTNLTHLGLNENLLTGTIPAELGNLSNLQFLHLSFLDITGPLPSELGNLTKLEYFHLFESSLTGTIPSSFNNLASLKAFLISNNELDSLPNLSSLTNLISCEAERNNFTFKDFDDANFNSGTYVTYNPQADLDLTTDTIHISNCGTVTLNCQDLAIDELSSSNNQYALYQQGNLVSTWTFDPEFIISPFNVTNAGNYTFKVKNSNYSALTLSSKTLTITTDNNQPTDMTLSNDTIDENMPNGSNVGELSTTDTDVCDTYTYTLIAGDGTNDADNSSFRFYQNYLLTNTVLDYEEQSSYNIYVRSTDGGGLIFEKAFVITLENINEAPSDITLNNNTINENLPSGSLVALLSTIDDDDPDSHTYSLITGTGTMDDENNSFEIKGDSLIIVKPLNFEQQENFNIFISSVDEEGLYLNKAFTLTCLNVNEAPSNIHLSNNSIDEDVSPGTAVGQFSSVDEDSGDSHTFSLITGDGTNDADNASFLIEGNNLKTASELDYETKSEYHIYIQTEDKGGSTFAKEFIINVNDVTETGIDEIDDKTISIYPNPSSGKFFIEFDASEYQVKVYDIAGSLVYNQIASSPKHEIDLSGSGSGQYIISIQKDEQNFQQKVFVQ